jgi:hypothetical protein
MKLSYDLYYLRNANLMLDLLILLKTLRLVLRGEGAVPIEARGSQKQRPGAKPRAVAP